MDAMKVVKLTNKVAFFSVGLLAYWVFIFVSITVFDFKVFKENITQAFYLSILGVFALLGGAIILNIMLNMTRIAECLENGTGRVQSPSRVTRNWKIAAATSFPVIFGLLYVGDLSSSMKKKEVLLEAATYMATEHRETIDALSDYSFSAAYLQLAASSLKVLAKVEERFPTVTVIARDTIDNKPVFLSFSRWGRSDDDKEPKKEDYIYSASKAEREYLKGVFEAGMSSVRFSAHDGRYELYFPVKTSRGVIVLYLSDRQRYGKIGS